MLLYAVSVSAQDDGELRMRVAPPARQDSLLRAFGAGRVHGSARYYFMATINDGALTDYYANAAGGSLSYETGSFHHFSVGAAAGFAFNIGSSDLTRPDSISGQPNRYEIGLFDITDPANKVNMARLEALYLKYTFAGGFVQFGKLSALNTPFINPQDGRMRPGVEEGLWTSIRFSKRLQLAGGWLTGFSPRSTWRWYKPGASLGLYPQGVNADGSKSAYLNNVESAGVGIAQISGNAGTFSYTILEQFAEHLFNTAGLSASYAPIRFAPDNAISFAAQAYRQDAVENGGADDQKKTYFPKDNHAWIFSGQLRWSAPHWDCSINGIRITRDGRYLSPREWGRNPFFTFMPRERNEGLSDVTAFVVKGGYRRKSLSSELSMGHYNLPDVTNFARNKYGQPSYTQLNAELRYVFSGALKGFDALLLCVYKKNDGDLHGNPRYEDNKVNMSLINVVLNFRF